MNTATRTRYTSPEDVKNLKLAQEDTDFDYETWEEYIYQICDDYGVSSSTGRMIFDMLGSTEAFDGFLTTMEDAADGEDFE
jgi:hypothetical protein